TILPQICGLVYRNLTDTAWLNLFTVAGTNASSCTLSLGNGTQGTLVPEGVQDYEFVLSARRGTLNRITFDGKFYKGDILLESFSYNTNNNNPGGRIGLALHRGYGPPRVNNVSDIVVSISDDDPNFYFGAARVTRMEPYSNQSQGLFTNEYGPVSNNWQ